MHRLLLLVISVAAPGCLFVNVDVGDGPPDAAVPPTPDAAFDPSDCSLDLPCPLPDGTKTMICGRILDVQTSSPSDGAGLEVRFYDALAFANDPTTAPQLNFRPDACGRFVSRDGTHGGVVVPGTTFLAVATDDDAAGADDFALTGVGLAGVPHDRVTHVHAYATRRSTDAAWSIAGPSFVAQGVYVGIFIDQSQPPVGPYPGAPRAGVRVLSDGVVNAANDFYFDDAQPLERASVGTSATTGANGTALYTSGDLVEYSGTSAGCQWPSTLAKTIPGAVWVQERIGTCN